MSLRVPKPFWVFDQYSNKILAKQREVTKRNQFIFGSTQIAIMIIHFKKDTSSTQIEELRSETQGIVFQQGNEHILVSSSNMKQIPQHFETIVSNYYVMNSDIQLADKSYLSKRHIQLGDLTIGNEINTHGKGFHSFF